MKKIIYPIIFLLYVVLALGYTAPTYTDIDLVLDTGYTAPSYGNIDLVLDTVAVDTCTCAGLNTNWEIDMSDYCNITATCNLGIGYLNFTGSGETRCNATINTTDLGDPGANGILYIQDNCIIYVRS